MSDEQNKPRMMYNPAFPNLPKVGKPHPETAFCSIVDPPCIPYEESIQEEVNKKEVNNA